jgi:ABC-type uncharacterized transport system permease subunit
VEPLKILYWSRLGLGILAALTCTLLRLDDFISGLSLGILFYILTHYILKRRFATETEKPSKVFTIGIGVYFMSWIVSWGLFYTLALWFRGVV